MIWFLEHVHSFKANCDPSHIFCTLFQLYIIGAPLHMYATPFFINGQGKTEHLERVTFGSGYNESWLQQLLFDNPRSLPLQEIDPAYQQLCPLCREMNTGSGPVDIVYVTPQGRLVIIETKLWKNPEARRVVVGQILDYAKELKNWSYADLQREVSRRTGIKGNSPHSIVTNRFGEIDEAVFVDGVTQSLRHGDFMLVIAGDGIRQDAQGIVEFIQDAGNMRFVLALIEVAVYKHPESGFFFVQPRTLVKTQQIRREVDYGLARIPTDDPNGDKEEWRLKYKEYWTRFLVKLVLDDPEQPRPQPTALGNIFFPLPPSGGVAWVNVYFSKQHREVGCFLRICDKPVGQELFQSLNDDREGIEKDLPFDVEWDSGRRIVMRTKKITGEWPPLHDPRVDIFFVETINGLINTFRPRLKGLSGE